MSERRFDPEAAEEFAAFLQNEIDTLNTLVIDGYFTGDGALAKMPAFGVGGDSDDLKSKYTRFHGGVWGDLKGLIASHEGFIDALDQAIETSAETEAATAAELDGQM